MRISDLSTFDSKPILWSQLDELLRNKNITMLGNQANIPSGLVVLDDKGKIPEDADIQHIFYVDNEFPTSGLVKNSLYVSSTGEARATDDNAEYINISLQVVTDFSTVSDDTIATTKAIKDYVDTAVTEVATGSSGVLSSYATKEYVDSAVASASGEQHIFYVDALPSIEDAIENSLYVVKGTKEAQIFDGTEYAPISLEALTDFSTVSNDTLATTQAISAFVDEKISNIDIPDPDLSAYQPVSGMSEYAKKTDIPDVPEEVIYVDEFPTSGLLDTIYVNQNGQSKIWNGTEFVSMSYEIVDSISTETSQSGVVVPSVQAVIDYVSAYTPTLPDNITTQGNEFNTGNQLVQLVNGKIPESLYNSDTQHIFYVDEFPVSGVENSIYVKNNSETKLYVSGTFVPMSVEVATDILTASASSVVSVFAMQTYLSGYYADKAYVTDAIANAMLSGEVDLTPYAKTEWVTSELTKKADLSSLVDHIYYVSALPEPSSAISGSIYIISGSAESVYFTGTEFVSLSLETVTDFSTVSDETLATTQAISAFVDEKISNIDIPSTDLSNYYTKTETDDKFITSANIPKEVVYTSEFPSSGINNAIYVNDEGQSKIYANDNWIDISLKVDTEITSDAVSSVPTTKAVYDFVSSASGSSVDLTNYNGNVSLHTTNSEQGWMASYFVADGQKIQMEYTNVENNSFAIASSNFIGIGVYRTEGKESIEITNNNISISASNLTYNGFNTNTGNGLVELVDGKIPSGLYNTTNIPDNTLLVESVSDFPTSGTNNTMYIADSSEARIYTDGEWKNISIEAVENLDNPNQTTVPTTQAVKDYIDANSGSSSIQVGDGLTGTGASASPLKLDLSNYSQDGNISITASGDAYLIGSSEVRLHANGPGLITVTGEELDLEAGINFNVTAENINFNSHAKNTAGGFAIVEDSGKLPTSIIPETDLSNYYNKTESDEKFALKDDVNSKLALSVVEDFPSSGINNTLYVNNENHAQVYANDQWKDIALEVVENFETVNQTTVPTTQAVKDYVDTIQVGPSMKTEATTNAIIFKKDTSIYKIEVANATTFTFDFSQLDENNCYTFELWVSMSTPVTLTFPSDVAWLNDEVPDMSEASTYCIVVRKLPSTMGTSTITSPKALLNLAYQYPLVLG